PLRHVRAHPGGDPRGRPRAGEVVMHPLERRPEPAAAVPVDRRTFMKAGAAASAAALIVEFRFPLEAQAATGFEPNAFVRIAPDNTITIVAKHLEMGQGAYTGIATVVAEE